MVSLTLWFIVVLVTLAFVCEFVDSALGMGYGTTLTPILLIMGYEPIQIVPTILISELFSGILAGIYHHREGNVNFRPKTVKWPIISRKIKSLGLFESFRRGVPLHLRVALLLAACSIVGTIAAVFLAVNLPKFWIKLYIGVLVLLMGIIILACFNKRFSFSWKKIIGLGLLSSFNKGISGGGYGPVVTSGQILSGVDGKSAVGITSLAEGLTCAVGILTYALIAKSSLDLHIVPFILTGAILSVPLSAKSVKIINENQLKMATAVLTILLGLFTIWKALS